MEPENDGFQKEGISSSRGPFSGSMLVFGGVFHKQLYGLYYGKTQSFYYHLG